MILLDLTIPGDPVPKGRPRTVDSGTYTPTRTRNAELVAGTLMRHQLRARRPVTGPVGVDVTFFCATRRQTDGDNLLKLVLDSANGIVYVDDSQVLEYYVRVYRGVGPVTARTTVRFTTLEE